MQLPSAQVYVCLSSEYCLLLVFNLEWILLEKDTINTLILIQTNYIIVKPSWCQLYNFSCIYNKIIYNKKPSAHILIYTNIYNKKKRYFCDDNWMGTSEVEYKISISDFFIIYCGFFFDRHMQLFSLNQFVYQNTLKLYNFEK